MYMQKSDDDENRIQWLAKHQYVTYMVMIQCTEPVTSLLVAKVTDGTNLTS
jgi:hypothetical protein